MTYGRQDSGMPRRGGISGGKRDGGNGISGDGAGNAARNLGGGNTGVWGGGHVRSDGGTDRILEVDGMVRSLIVAKQETNSAIMAR